MKHTRLLTLLVLLLTAATGAWGMEVYVSYPWPTGTTSVNSAGNLMLEMEPSDSFDNLKAKIQDKSGLDPAYMLLYYNSAEMDDNETLYEKNIQSQSVLTLVYTATQYTVKVVGGTADKEKAYPGETVTITADDPDPGQFFEKWWDGNLLYPLKFAHANASATTFVMPARDVTNLSSIYVDVLNPFIVALADGTDDADKWKVSLDGTTFGALPIGRLTGDGTETVTLKYSGTRKVKSVTATTDATPAEPVTLATPLTIEAITAGTIVVINPQEGMQYLTNGGTTKTAMTNYTTTYIPLEAGQKVQFYGNGTSITQYGFDHETSFQAESNGFTCKVYGNIMSLVNETGYETATTLSGQYVFWCLFAGNDALTDASELLLPATTLTKSCYSGMFSGCSSLTAGPKLPATELAEACYNAMFYNCSSLTSAYVKAAYTNGNIECTDMFKHSTAAGAVLHTTSGNKASWETMMGTGKTWSAWSVADDWQD